MSQFKQSLFATFFAAGKCSVLVAEQLALDQRVRDRGAVQRHKRVAAVQSLRMDGAGEQFLAGAAFAADQHGRFVAGHVAGQLDDRQHVGVTGDDVVEADLAGLGDRVHHFPDILHVAQRQDHTLHRAGLVGDRTRTGQAVADLAVIVKEQRMVDKIDAFNNRFINRLKRRQYL